MTTKILIAGGGGRRVPAAVARTQYLLDLARRYRTA
jgi:hypothetical protein